MGETHLLCQHDRQRSNCNDAVVSMDEYRDSMGRTYLKSKEEPTTAAKQTTGRDICRPRTVKDKQERSSAVCSAENPWWELKREEICQRESGLGLAW